MKGVSPSISPLVKSMLRAKDSFVTVFTAAEAIAD